MTQSSKKKKLYLTTAQDQMSQCSSPVHTHAQVGTHQLTTKDQLCWISREKRQLYLLWWLTRPAIVAQLSDLLNDSL